MEIGFLDFGEINKFSNAVSVVFDSIELAKKADYSGFKRYWIAEHHEDTVAYKNPEIIVNIIAGFTDNIRVGVAGVLLPLSPPLQVAQRYKLLNNIYSNRIDLGLAKGITNTEKNRELTDHSDIALNVDSHNDRCLKVISFLNDTNSNFLTHPVKGDKPEVWILTTSDRSKKFIIDNRLNFSLSLFHNRKEIPSPEIIKGIKKEFFDKHSYFPKFNIAISVYLGKNRKDIKEVIADRDNILVNIATTEKYLKDEINKLSRLYESEELIIVNLGRTVDEKMELIEFLATNFIK